MRVKEMTVFTRNCPHLAAEPGWLVFPAHAPLHTWSGHLNTLFRERPPPLLAITEGWKVMLVACIFTHLMVFSASGEHISWKRNGGETIFRKMKMPL